MAARSPCRRCLPAQAEELPDLSGAPANPPIFPVRIALGGDVDWTAFTVWLSALLHARGDDVMRVKGVVRTPAGRLLLQSVRKMVQRPEVLPEQGDREDDVIVVIGRGYERGRSQEIVGLFRRQTISVTQAIGESPGEGELLPVLTGRRSRQGDEGRRQG